MLSIAFLAASGAHAQGTPVFDNLPGVRFPVTWSSLGFQAVATPVRSATRLSCTRRYAATRRIRRRADVELVAALELSGDARRGLRASDHPQHLRGCGVRSARTCAGSSPITQTFTIPWRPAADASCSDGNAWRSAVDGAVLQRPRRSRWRSTFARLNFDLPSQFIYSVAVRHAASAATSRSASPGRTNSLNVGYFDRSSYRRVPARTSMPTSSTGTPRTAAWYSDGGARSARASFRADTGMDRVPDWRAVQRRSRCRRPRRHCKNGAWQNLVRADFSAFRNQGACVSYVNFAALMLRRRPGATPGPPFSLLV